MVLLVRADQDLSVRTSTHVYLVSGAIISNVLYRRLQGRFGPRIIAQLASSTFALNNRNFSGKDRQLIVQSYMDGLRAVFVSYIFLVLVHLCACVCIEDYGLRKADERESHGEEAITQSSNN